VLGRHQYKRIHVDGQYERRCRFCGKKEFVRGSYRTALAVIEEWLSGRERYLENQGYWGEMEYDDPLDVYGGASDSEEEEQQQGLVELPTATLDNAEAKMQASRRKVARWETALKESRLRAARIAARIRDDLETEGVVLDERSAINCLADFICVTRFHDTPMTERQLEYLEAAVAYVCSGNPSRCSSLLRARCRFLTSPRKPLVCDQECPAPSKVDIVGSNLSRPTLDDWIGYVEQYAYGK